MKSLLKLSLLPILLLIFFACSQEIKQSNDWKPEVDTKEFQEYSKKFVTKLKSELMKNMQQGGPIQAVYVCSDSAQIITKEFVNDSIDIKRVTNRLRNEENVPDNFEKNVLSYFHTLKEKNELTKKVEVAKIVEVDGKKIIRYMKPILIEAPCLNCHGNAAQIDAAVSTMLNKKYSNDDATGYKIGDLRGAISIIKKIK